MSLPGPWDVTAKWFMLVESAKLGIRAEFHIQADLVVKLGIKGNNMWLITYPPTSRLFNISLHNPPSQIFCPCILSVIRLRAFDLNCKYFPSAVSRSPCLLEELS